MYNFQYKIASSLLLIGSISSIISVISYLAINYELQPMRYNCSNMTEDSLGLDNLVNGKSIFIFYGVLGFMQYFILVRFR